MSISKYRDHSGEFIEYPDSDGKPMADNTKQARWIIRLYNNLKNLFHKQDVFVAADLLWYPEEGKPTIVTAPDTMIVFDRPDGDRSSYKQWEEEGIAPQVVFEVLSPSNSHMEMLQKQAFYEKYGVEELVIIDPGKREEDPEKFVPYYRQGDHLVMSAFPVVDWTSKKLGIRFRLEEGRITVFYPDGKPFQSFTEIMSQLEDSEQKIEEEKQRVEAEKERAEMEKRRADQAEAELAKLRAKLKDLEE